MKTRKVKESESSINPRMKHSGQGIEFTQAEFDGLVQKCTQGKYESACRDMQVMFGKVAIKYGVQAAQYGCASVLGSMVGNFNTPESLQPVLADLVQQILNSADTSNAHVKAGTKWDK